MWKYFSYLLWMIIMLENSVEDELNLIFQQNDYKFTFERIEMVSYNKEYLTEMSMVTYKYNRTTPLANGTIGFKVDVGHDLVGIVQAYKFMSNEYRPFPIHVGAHFCKILEADTGGCKRLLNCGNFTGCPLRKNKLYRFCNFTPDGSKCPPYIPNGEYKIEVQGMYFSKEVFVLNLYATVTRPFVKK